MSNGPRGVPQSLPVAVGVPLGQQGPSLSSPKGWPLACPRLQPWAGSFIPEFGGVLCNVQKVSSFCHMQKGNPTFYYSAWFLPEDKSRKAGI